MSEERSAFDDAPLQKKQLFHKTEEEILVQKYAIDFKQVNTLFQKLKKSFPNEQQMRAAIERLIELFSFEYSNSQKTPENVLMIWRGMIILLQMESLNDWDWSHILVAILHALNESSKETRHKSTIIKSFLT